MLLFFITAISAEQLILPSHPKLRYQGRIDNTNPNEYHCDWPWFVVDFNFTGKSLTILLEDWGNRYDIFINGSRLQLKLDSLQTPDNRYVIPDSLLMDSEKHHCRLIKRTEFEFPTYFRGFIINDTARVINKPEEFQLRIELIGDSFLTGHGCESPDNGNGDVTDPDYGDLYYKAMLEYSNIGKSVGAILGDSLKADIQISAISGKGIIRNGSGLSQDNFIFDYYSHTHRKEVGTSKGLWDFNKWQADIVIIHLGINDFGAGLPPADITEWILAYRSALAEIRKNYPGVKIICMATKEWDKGLLPSALKSVIDMEQKDGKKDVHYFQYSINGEALGWHPSVKENEYIAELLLKEIRSIISNPITTSLKIVTGISHKPLRKISSKKYSLTSSIQSLILYQVDGTVANTYSKLSTGTVLDFLNLSKGFYYVVSISDQNCITRSSLIIN